jgi:ribosomal protein L37E
MSDSVRDEVRAALARREEAPLRTCPRCGREERTREEHCPHCGYSYFARPPAAAQRRRIAIVTVALLTLAAVGVVIAVLVHDNNDRNATDRATHAKLVAAEVARLRRIQAHPTHSCWRLAIASCSLCRMRSRLTPSTASPPGRSRGR